MEEEKKSIIKIIAMLTLDRIDFKAKTVIRHKNRSLLNAKRSDSPGRYLL